MTKREPLEALQGDEFRIMCPVCRTMWTTLLLPSECPDCGQEVTLKLIPRKGA